MFEFIEGEIIELNPSYVVIKSGSIGFFIHISLNTYSSLHHKKQISIFIHQIIREDAQLLFGFSDKSEREIFRHLIAVSGIGANTARMMLSSLSPSEIQQSIIKADVNLLKSIKGIGLKTAQRIIVELKDKLGKIDQSIDLFGTKDNTIKNEALSALVMLGFTKSNVSKALEQVCKDLNINNMTVEELVKQALKKL